MINAPIHYPVLDNGTSWAACGVYVIESVITLDCERVTCKRCQRTRRFREAVPA